MNVFDYPMEIRDYLQLFLRNKLAFAIPFVLVLSIAIGIAFVLPPMFKSEATFLIQRQTIPQNFAQTTVTGYIQEQIQQIRQRIVTHENLVRLADRNNLYPDELAANPTSVVQKLRERIEVGMEDVQATDPNSGGVRTATVAFTLAVSAETGKDAQMLTRQLAERFLLEHRTARELGARQVTGFFEEESQRLQLEISELEAALAGFKQEEIRNLPELMSMNLSLFERTQREIDQTENRIIAIEQQINVTRAELSLTEPYKNVVTDSGETMLTGAERLSALTAQYLQATSRYSQEHPDVKRLSREIRLLSEQNGTSHRTDEIMGRLVALQEEVRQARQTYSDSHPTVVDLESAIASLQRGLQSAVVSDSKSNELALPPDNPRYVALQTAMSGDEATLNAEKANLAELKVKLDEYEERIFTTPLVERDYKSLARDYDNKVAKFQELKDKQLQARLAEEIEGGDNAEQFVLESSAYLPRLPESPNRVGIILLGAFFGLVIGIAVVVLIEYFDKTIRNSRMIFQVLGVQPLATIPEMPQRAKVAASGDART